ncbi:MAG: hypothetical protein CMF37_15535 [Leeuwenhoekiella sp.]|nr:hypothetical protein [Leeuwenhoekiella sp.]MBH14325.1 hypothetical protein [Leeuwenhoekiella sp.]MBQ50167.1 hypothetical protein [Leeuwenhoekiella sp.]MBQ50364.1 hypothetical protein [Leeuwenhoekiella sp.]MBQ50561.1 hypothetical protein [Leeuwenhoekiella sp.]|tara:strand:+ start:2338 stop:2874 length:537 start_codon:yes stop_codon:yes gene_type:complete
MTTIVWDGQQLASDSQLTVNWNVISQEPFIKLQLLKGIFINPETKEEDNLVGMGFSGDAAQIYPFRDWLLAGCKREEYAEEFKECCVILVCRNSVWQFHYSPDPLPVRNTVAVGSGCDFATSALSLGKTAPEAVRHAIKHDVYSSGPVVCLSIDEAGKPFLHHYNDDVSLEATASLAW